MFQQRGIPTVVFPGRCEVRLNSLLESLSSSKRLLAWEFIVSSKGLSQSIDGLKKFGAGLERIEQRRDIRSHRETVAPVIRILRDPEMENPG